MKDNIGLCAYAVAQLGRPYWFGTYGQFSSKKVLDEKRKSYPKYYKAKDFENQFGYKVHDCSGLIKGYMMSPNNEAPAEYNAKYDINADTMINSCKITGTVGNIPEVGGLLVWRPGHVGIYIGNGIVIEARGHNYGVVRSVLKNRDFKKWGVLPFIQYVGYEEFVDRLYGVFFNRDADADGEKFWVERLKNGVSTPTDVIKGFAQSAEFENKQKDDEEYVTILYKAFFDRAPDELAFWVNITKTYGRGVTLDGFSMSQEWQNTSKYITDLSRIYH